MGLSIVKFFLMPCQAEVVERRALRRNDELLEGIAKEVKYTRNSFYLGAVLTIIAATGAILCRENVLIQRYACSTCAILGIGITSLALKKFYNLNQLIPFIPNKVVRFS